MTDLRRLLFLLLCLPALAAAARTAEATPAFASARFVRVGQAEQLADGAFYLIGATGANGHFFLLTSQPYKQSSGTKLRGVLHDAGATTHIDAPPAEAVWQLCAEGTHWRFATADGRASILAASRNANSLEISESTFSLWDASVTAEGAFVFADAQSPDFFLGISEYGSANALFGHFKATGADNCQLVLFKLLNAATPPDTARQPADGSRVTFFADMSLPAADFSALPAQPCLLSDGTAAPDAFPAWDVETLSDGTFRLRNPQGLYLQPDLSHSAAPAGWTVTDGRIASTAAPARRVVFHEQAFRTVEAASAPANAATAVFISVGAEPDSALSDGVKTLTGAWSAPRLAQLSWHGVQNLDLTALTLPASATAFNSQPSGTNALIFVSTAQQPYVPQSWERVIAGETLITPARLADRQTLLIDRPFSVADGQLTYSRTAHADGLWETLCLPFTASVPPLFAAERLTSRTADALVFTPTDVIPANEPVIIRYTGAAAQPYADFSVSARASAVVPLTPTGTQLQGTFAPLTVSGDALLLLNPSGTAFVRPAAGSTLSPFRAALPATAGVREWRIRHADTSTISSPHATAPAATTAFGLDGKPARERRGIVIENHKTLYIP